MKSILKLHSTALLISGLVLCNQVFATDNPLVEKKKTYNKSYSVSSSDKISLENRFGELKITTWDKNEVKVDITITAEAGTDEKAQRILDGITIEDGKSGDGVYFKTKINDNKKDDQWEKGEKQKFSINYNVYLPSRNPLKASNEFGAMFIGDYTGEATLQSKFGSLTAGKITNAKKITVEFGKATIEAVRNGDLIVKFSQASIGNLDGSVDAVFEHCGGIKLNIDNNLKELSVRNEFTSLYLDVTTNLSANFDIHTSFAELNNKTDFNIKEEWDGKNDRGPNFNHKYSGKSGSGNTDVKVSSNFGKVTVGHNLPDNVVNEKSRGRNGNHDHLDKDKNKNKDKDKEKNKEKKRETAI
jgi:hypothetical protein